MNEIDEIKEYTLNVYSENHIGLLNQITIIFTRRKVNIESLTVSESQIEGIHSFTIVTRTTEHQIKKIVKQIEKLVEVLKAFVYEDNEIVYQEIALYKIPTTAITGGIEIGRIIRNNNARILDIQPDYIVIEKTGKKSETQELLKKLEPYDVHEFIRSGRVAITKPMKKLTEYLKDLEEGNYHEKN